MPMDPGKTFKGRLAYTILILINQGLLIRSFLRLSNYLFDNYTSINISNRLALKLPEG